MGPAQPAPGVSPTTVGEVVPAVAPRVLVIGLDPYRVPGPWDPAPVAAAIAASMTALSARGFDAESCLVGLDGSEDVHAVAVAALQSRP